MIWSKFQEFFHPSWWPKMQKFIESKECDEIYTFLKEEARRGKKIAPISSLTWRAFKETPLTDLKCIIIGLCPYHTFVNGSPVADGIALSCSITGKLQPSLDIFYDALEKEMYDGLNLDYVKYPDLTYLANEGVLLINAAMTTEMNKAGNHVSKWEPFMKYFLEEAVGYTGIPILLMGKEAQKLEKYITPFTHVFKVEHPSYAARMSQEWDTKGSFKKISKIIKENNNYEIKWLCELAF